MKLQTKIIIDLLIILGISIIAFHRVLDSGVILTLDLDFPMDLKGRFESLFYAWDPMRQCGVDQFAAGNLPSYAILSSLAGIGIGSGIIEKILLISSFAVAGFSMYFLTYILGGRRTLRLASSLLYIANPWVFDRTALGQVWLVLGYAFFPLFIGMYIKSFRSGTLRDSLVSGFLLFSLVAVDGSFAFAYLASIFALIYFIYQCANLVQKYKTKSFRPQLFASFKRIVKIFLTVVITAGLLLLYIIIPIVFTISGSGFPVQSATLFKEYVSWYPFPFQDIIRLINTKPYSLINSLQQPCMSNVLWFALSFGVFLSALSAIILRHRDKKVISFFVLTLVSLAISANITFPIDIISLLRYIPGFSLPLRDNTKFTALASLGYAYLAGVTLDYIVHSILPAHNTSLVITRKGMGRKRAYIKNHIKRLIGIALVGLIVASIFVSSWPMFTGNFGGTLQDVNFPPEYMETYNWLASKPGDFRILFLPSPRGVVDWLPDRNSLSRNIPTPFGNSPPKSSLFFYEETVPRLNDRFFSFLQSVIENNLTIRMGKLLSFLNIRYIVLRTDIDSWLSPKMALSFLSSQEDLELVFHKGAFYVFDNKNPLFNHIFASSENLLVCGDRNVFLTMCSSTDTELDRLCVTFSDQVQQTAIQRFIKQSDTVLFNNADFKDLLFETINDNCMVDLSKYAENSINATKYWVQIDGSAVRFYLRSGDQQARDTLFPIFSQGEYFSDDGFAYTNGNDSKLAVPVDINVTQGYCIWARILYEPNPGYFSVYFNGHTLVKGFRPYSDSFKGFQWVNLGEFNITKGNNILTLVNEGGSTAIDKIALISPKSYDSWLNALTQFFEKQTTVRIAYMLEAETAFGSHLNAWQIERTSNASGGLTLTSPYNPCAEVALSGTPTGLRVSILNTHERTITYGLNIFQNGINRYTDFNFATIKPGQSITKEYNFSIADYNINGTDGDKFEIFAFEAKGLTDVGTIHPTSNVLVYGVPVEASTQIFVPVAGRYIVALRVATGPDYGCLVIKINNNSYVINATSQESTDFEYRYVGPIDLSVGQNNITIATETPSAFKIDNLLIYSLKDSEMSLQVNNLFNDLSDSASLNFSKINPSKYVVHVKADRPFFLVFDESYNPLWQAYSGNHSFTHSISYSFLNGFYINETGEYDLVIEYVPQGYKFLGIALSAVVFSAMIIYLCIYPLSKKLLRIYKERYRR